MSSIAVIGPVVRQNVILNAPPKRLVPGFGRVEDLVWRDVSGMPMPQTVATCGFGGRAQHRHFITATTSNYAITLDRSGVQFP